MRNHLELRLHDLFGEVLKAFLNRACFQVQNAIIPHAPDQELDETLGDSVGDLTESHSENQNDPRSSQQHKQTGPTNQCSITSDEEHDTDIAPVTSLRIKKAKSRLRCPHPECKEKSTYSRETHLQRHYKMHVSCDVQCGCGKSFNRVDLFEKHLPNCSTMQNEEGGGATLNEDRDACRVRTLGLKKHLSSKARTDLTQALTRVGAETEQETTSENHISEGQSNSEENMEHHHQKPKLAHTARRHPIDQARNRNGKESGGALQLEDRVETNRALQKGCGSECIRGIDSGRSCIQDHTTAPSSDPKRKSLKTRNIGLVQFPDQLGDRPSVSDGDASSSCSGRQLNLGSGIEPSELISVSGDRNFAGFNSYSAVYEDWASAHSMFPVGMDQGLHNASNQTDCNHNIQCGTGNALGSDWRSDNFGSGHHFQDGVMNGGTGMDWFRDYPG
ncbi:MAG: hypothetical protein M1839_003205 [Geoglossum umbratile]|nr:MAG: hypothetical protein M1839_003205 [Geoglossum umbratile]